MCENNDLFLNENRSDVRILVSTESDVWRFPAHSLILCNASQSLASIIETQPVNEEGYIEIVIEELSSETVLNMLRYIYCGKITIHKWKDALELLYAACKYQLLQLIADCENLLANQLNVTNVCEIIEQARRLQLVSIESKCVEIIKINALVILNSSSFLNLSRSTLTSLLGADDLNIQDEIIIFRALWKWGKRECCRLGRQIDDENIGEVLNNLLDHIRIQHIKDSSALPLCLRSRIKPQPILVKGKHDKKHDKEELQDPCKKERIIRPIDMFSCSANISLVGPRCWEGIHEATERNTVCALISTNRSIYLTGFCIDVIERNALCNSLFISVSDEMKGTEIARQECRWIDSYDRRNQNVIELWHLSQTSFAIPVYLQPNVIYSITLHAIDSRGDAFPFQNLKQRYIQENDGLYFTLHASELIALRNLHFIPFESNDVWG